MMRKDLEVSRAAESPFETAQSPAPGTSPMREQDFAAALLAVGGVADRAMVCRVQRNVREQAIEMTERRQRLRHSIGLTILGFSLLLLVLTPVIYSCMHLEDSPDFEMQFVYLIGWLFPITLMALVLVFMRARTGGDARKGGMRQIDHRVTSRLGSMVR